MKKLIVIFISLCLMLVLAGCNMSLGFGNYEFNGIHVCDIGGNSRDLTVIKWHDDSTGIEIKTKEAGSLFCSEGTYILYEDQCPICSSKAG